MSITVNKCAKCGHEWPQSSKRPPRRCPAPGCRTVKWRSGLSKALDNGLKVSNQIAKMVTGRKPK